MAPVDGALQVLFWPSAAFVLLAVVHPLRRTGRLAGWVSIVAVAAAFVRALALWTAGQRATALWSWIPADGGPVARVGVLLDELSAAMLVLVTFVSLLVQVYSLAYLAPEAGPALGRYYTYQSLFAASMLGLVLSPTWLQMFIFWELVGLCSYLLIGFWYQRPAAARAAVKAFWITRLGDVGFVVGIVWVWGLTGTFEFPTLFEQARAGALDPTRLAVPLLLIYFGAAGKSAQFPLHVWLPDAMEGPTPVSALIHAATMVTAGVFLVVRGMPLFALTPEVLTLIASVGAFTALLAATMACVEADIKRVLAYSTISQLGYMMAAAGAGAPAAGFLHLLTHGVFKALLFLAAGAVIHAMGTNDIHRMGQLFRALPQTGTTFVVGALALAGVWPLAGFFSKEAVLAGVWEAQRPGAFVLLAATAFLTAFYMFRVVFLVFFGRAHAGGHTHEPPALMAVPLWVLALLAVGLGLGFQLRGVPDAPHGPGWLAPLSLVLAASGFGLAFLLYQRRAWDPVRLSRTFPLNVLEALARRRFGMDALYETLYQVFLLALSRLVGWVDRYLVDGVVNFSSAWTLRAGDRLRRLQSGVAQDYVYGVAFGLLVLFVWAQWMWR